jgi:hypothetical protein
MFRTPGQLDDDAVAALALNQRLGDAVRIDALLDDLLGALDRGVVLGLGGEAAGIRLEDDVGAALEIEAQAKALAVESPAKEIKVQAWTAREIQPFREICGQITRIERIERTPTKKRKRLL